MTVVVKLGSSIVAGEDGELRADVLDSVCQQVAEMEKGGEKVVMVTSGAIARGIRLLQLGRRPSSSRRIPRAIAPEVTITTFSPPFSSSATCEQTPSSTSPRSSPLSPATIEEPSFTTTVMGRQV